MRALAGEEQTNLVDILLTPLYNVYSPWRPCLVRAKSQHIYDCCKYLRKLVCLACFFMGPIWNVGQHYSLDGLGRAWIRPNITVCICIRKVSSYLLLFSGTFVYFLVGLVYLDMLLCPNGPEFKLDQKSGQQAKRGYCLNMYIYCT